MVLYIKVAIRKKSINLFEGNDIKLKVVKVRYDRKGTPIVRRNKAHNISFKDMISAQESLFEIVEVESYKDYNVILNEDEGNCIRSVSESGSGSSSGSDCKVL